MFTVLYKWRIRPGLERQFIDSWSEITVYYRENAGSLGSRLHRGSDGYWYGYAQWPSDEVRRAAFENRPSHTAREKMAGAIEESFDEIRLEITADYLLSPKS
jgi:hypothetical protein